MWPDHDTDIDYLNYSEQAELIQEMIDSPDILPVSIGVFGGWGTGKSSILRLVEKSLRQEGERHLVIEFDAWMYQDFDDAKSALMSVIAAKVAAAAPNSVRDKAKGLLERVDRMRALGLIAEFGAAAAGLPTFGAAQRGLGALGRLFQGNADEEDSEALQEARKEIWSKAGSLLREKEAKSPPEEIDEFRAEFGEVLREMDRTLVVFVDNLDRCLPKNAIETLEAIRLFLFLPRTAFVIAADEDMIRHAVAVHFRDPSDRHVSDYLDKLIQVPMRVPLVGLQEVRAYLFMLFASTSGIDSERVEGLRSMLIDRLRKLWTDDPPVTVDEVMDALQADDNELRGRLDLADRLAPTLAYSAKVSGNPRIVKRMLNVVRMRHSVARRRGMELDEGIIAKLALLERCTDEAVTRAFHRLVNEAGDGKPRLLAELQVSDYQGTKEIEEKFPEAWRGEAARTIWEWAQLPPKLSGVDLRPAIYLARETLPLRIEVGPMSPAAMRAVRTLLDTASLSSRASADAIAALDSTEHARVMEALVSEMRRNSDWRNPRKDFRGAVLLAGASSDAAQILRRFIATLQDRRMWMKRMLEDHDLDEANRRGH